MRHLNTTRIPTFNIPHRQTSLIVNPLLKVSPYPHPPTTDPHTGKQKNTYPSINKFAPLTRLILGVLTKTTASPTSSNAAVLPCLASHAFQSSVGSPPVVPITGFNRSVRRKPGETAFTRIPRERDSNAAFPTIC